MAAVVESVVWPDQSDVSESERHRQKSKTSLNNRIRPSRDSVNLGM